MGFSHPNLWTFSIILFDEVSYSLFIFWILVYFIVTTVFFICFTYILCFSHFLLIRVYRPWNRRIHGPWLPTRRPTTWPNFCASNPIPVVVLVVRLQSPSSSFQNYPSLFSLKYGKELFKGFFSTYDNLLNWTRYALFVFALSTSVSPRSLPSKWLSFQMHHFWTFLCCTRRVCYCDESYDMLCLCLVHFWFRPTSLLLFLLLCLLLTMQIRCGLVKFITSVSAFIVY